MQGNGASVSDVLVFGELVKCKGILLQISAASLKFPCHFFRENYRCVFPLSFSSLCVCVSRPLCLCEV